MLLYLLLTIVFPGARGYSLGMCRPSQVPIAMPPRLSTRSTGLLPGPCWDRGQWKSLAEAGWGACSREPREVGRHRQAKPCKSRGSEPSAHSLLFHQPSLKRHKIKNKMIKNFKTVMLCSIKPQVQGPVEKHWSHAQETSPGATTECCLLASGL